MAPKAVMKHIKLDDIPVQDAIIIKQDMLSLGGDVAIPRDAFKLQGSAVSILIFGTISQLLILTEKLNRHYPRIQRIAQTILHVLEKN